MDKELDINLIKRFIDVEVPTNSDRVLSYYKQLKNILTVLSNKQIGGTTENHQQIVETIESKMKHIETKFGQQIDLHQNQGQQQQQQQALYNYGGDDHHNNNQQEPVVVVDVNKQQQQQQQQQQSTTIVQQTPVIFNTLQTGAADPLAAAKRRHHSSSSSSHHNRLGPPEIPPEEIVFDPKVDHLGGGAYGKVYRATCRGKRVAVKVPKKQVLSDSEKKAFLVEVEIMKQIFHPNVVLFLGACTKPGKIMIVSELMQSDLEKLIHSPDSEPPSLYQRMKMASDAAMGMNWLHGICNILHRDLKLANLMIGKDNTVKITDFGFSQVIKTGTNLVDQRGPKGTALYMAPEVMMKQEFNEKADVYSFGLILHELATCEELFPEYSEIEPFSDAICNKRIRPPIPSNIPRSLSVLMQRCWDHDPSVRPPFSEVVEKMNEVLIDIGIGDATAADFWKSNFSSTPEEVKWSEFAFKLSQTTNIDITQIKPLARLFLSNDDEDNGLVKIERFDLMNKWFGPFYSRQTGGLIVNEMNELTRRKWFHGDISRDVSERRLRGRPENTFLIRLSLNDPLKTPLTISKIKASKPTHKRVSREEVPQSSDFPMGLKFLVPVDGNDLVFNSITSMVDHLKNIGNLGPEGPQSEIKVPYIND
ncbi:SH2 domain-containing protein [Cavenderia fasciculata]|uniref:SH2 domain-containing protein n=1 Tax=Cavenderia fasciculata TaxID=261658 RepID=F4QF54_CACFS|nr:SH2 domain-containing protein [Cavenderia fasciculata]EGG14208.1 SH2 domain-containing protein [Cavenderia fasciculata]|eukprot:XP_004350916.1 SH2 domain-containing protein [Cavenderia fasciculata]